jgi:hypothetical protein
MLPYSQAIKPTQTGGLRMNNKDNAVMTEDKRRAVEATVEVLDSLPLSEIMAAYGFAMGLKAKQPAA